MSTPSSLPRRHFLRSSAALIALPLLESLGYRRYASAAAAATAAPKRFVFINFGWGVTHETWFPDPNKAGPDYTLSPGLEPLQRHKSRFTVVQGVTNKFAQDGHWGSTFWLTGANRYAEPGQSFRNTISADQVAASHLGLDTRFASLQLNGGSSSQVNGDGHGDGLSLAWDVRGKPLGGQNSPLEAYHRLFSQDASSPEKQRKLLERKQSVLDAVMDSAADIKRGLSKRDTQKMDEYFQGIRDIEIRLSREARWIGVERPKTGMKEPAAALNGKEEIEVMYDLMLAALQTDSTRVLTYRQATAPLLKSLGTPVLAHDMSHYGSIQNVSPKLDASQMRDAAQSALFAGLLDRLLAAKESDGSPLLDHTTVVYGSNLRTAHTLENCPTLVAGRGAGIRLGQHLVLPKGTPLCNVWLSLLKGSGVPVESHGDSTGIISELTA
jgi:hypothetical protein